MPPLRLANAADLYNPAIQRVYGDRYKMSPMNWKKWVIEENTDLYETTESAFGAFGQARQLNENTSVDYVDPDQGLRILGLIKSFLINGENLRETMVTLSKQVRQIKNCLIGQLQRLRERTLNLSEATIRAYMRI